MSQPMNEPSSHSSHLPVAAVFKCMENMCMSSLEAGVHTLTNHGPAGMKKKKRQVCYGRDKVLLLLCQKSRAGSAEP